MGEWKKTGCVLCAQNCGLEVLVEDNRMEKVRADKDNPRSMGYVCRKGMNVVYHQHHARPAEISAEDGERMLSSRISWDQAIGEIAEKLKIDRGHPRAPVPGLHGRRRTGLPLRGGLRGAAPARAGLPVSLQRRGPGVQRNLLGLRPGHGETVQLPRSRTSTTPT